MHIYETLSIFALYSLDLHNALRNSLCVPVCSLRV